MFLWPTTTKRITSNFRPPHRPTHNGLDIAESGYHEVFAIAAGTVSRSYTSESYGECIMIVHTINGQTWESVYAHLRSGSRKVRVGDKVKQGQIIGVMGNTGQSSGQHLHFELHKGRWNMAKSNAKDPLDYLGVQLQSSSDTYQVTKDTPGYSTAADAQTGKNKKGTVKVGTYYIFNKSNGMINVTGKKGVPGSWINPGTSVSSSTSLKEGQRVKVKATAKKYATGQNIPSWVKGKTYTIQQVKSDRVLLKEIMSWVKVSDVQ